MEHSDEQLLEKKREVVVKPEFTNADKIPQEKLDEIRKEIDQKEDFFRREVEKDKRPSMEKIPGQNFLVVSFAGEHSRPKAKHYGIKVWGAFETLDEAKTHAKYIGDTEECTGYDVFTMEMYSWAAIPPDITKIEDTEYHEEELNEIMLGHKKNREQIAKEFQMRKEMLVAAAEKASKEQQKFINEMESVD